VLIRDQSKQLQLENCLRISIGSENELSQLQELLTKL
jgi:histidinol-phosphate aminotransferase